MTTLDFYTATGPFTAPGRHAHTLEALPRELPALATAIPGLLIHEHLTSLYGVEHSPERKRESQLRPVEAMLDALLALDARPLSAAREPGRRLCGVCRHFTLLLTAALKQRGVAARARVGFASYFNAPRYEDHWVCEYWNAAQQRWVLVDPQLDAVQRKAKNIDFDPLDVPRDRFVIAGEAWRQCRAGERDADDFGISFVGLRGLWFVAGNVIRDAAALNSVEMLPWDVWGGMKEGALAQEELAFFDALAESTRAPDQHFEHLRRVFQSDARVKVSPPSAS